jgi:succinate dehydrogenase hydrophobic anchor subunit
MYGGCTQNMVVSVDSPAVQVANMTRNYVMALNNLQSLSVDNAERVHTALSDAKESFEDVEYNMGASQWWFIVAVTLTALLMLITMVFMYGVVSAWKGIQRPDCFAKVHKYIGMPFFVSLIVLAILTFAVSAIAAVMGADVCTGSPEKNTISVLSRKEANMDPLLFDMTVYFVQVIFCISFFI